MPCNAGKSLGTVLVAILVLTTPYGTITPDDITPANAPYRKHSGVALTLLDDDGSLLLLALPQ